MSFCVIHVVKSFDTAIFVIHNMISLLLWLGEADGVVGSEEAIMVSITFIDHSYESSELLKSRLTVQEPSDPTAIFESPNYDIQPSRITYA